MQTLKTRTVAILGAVLVGAAGLATAAQADVPQTRVSYGDLDAASPNGQKILTRRIQRAAQDVCNVEGARNAEILACRDKAFNGAVADLAQRGVTLR